VASSLKLVNLDVDTLRADFVEFLKTQEQYKDYNYDASNINVLLRLLAYNTFKGSFYLNMVGSEMFLDTAQMRESLFSHAKDLNYVPRSSRSAKARVRVAFQANGASQPYIFEKGDTFSTIIKSVSYFFSVAEDTPVVSGNSSFSVDLDVYEGVYVKDTYILDDSLETSRFKLTNKNADVDSLTVLVYEDGAVEPTTFRKANSLLDLTSKSDVFFLQGSENAEYEVLFGDNILGRRPANMSTIVLDYRITKGDAGNGAKVFTMDFDPTSREGSSFTVTTLSESFNGADPETNESIRFYAPRHFQTQERAVTARDYEIILKTQFPEIASVSVFGGEDLNPPRYGKVFVAVDVQDVEGLPDGKKIEYYNFLRSRSPLSVEPVFIEPEFTYVSLDVLVKYNVNKTTLTSTNIKAAAMEAIMDYNDEFLDDFNSNLRFSKLLAAIDEADPSIVGNETILRVYKKIRPVLGTAQNIIVDFGFPLDDRGGYTSGREPVIETSEFRYLGETMFIEDDAKGMLRYTKRLGNQSLAVSRAGTVDIKSGIVQFTNFIVDSYKGSAMKVYAQPDSNDVSSVKNTILKIEPEEVRVTVEVVRE
jgi:hypothetical protein